MASNDEDNCTTRNKQYVKDGVDDDDSEYDDGSDGSIEEENEDDEDEDDEGLLHYLFDKSLYRQHAIAVLVALVASYVSHSHFLSPHNSSASMDPFPSPTVKDLYRSDEQLHSNEEATTDGNDQKREETKFQPSSPYRMLKATEFHHHHTYRRTEHLSFCPTVDFFMPNESDAQRIQRVLFSTASDATTTNNSPTTIDSNLKLFDFYFPKEFADLMHAYYSADDYMDDDYSSLRSGEGIHKDERDEAQKCLTRAVESSGKRTRLPMYSVGYIRPTINTFYRSNMKEVEGVGNRDASQMDAVLTRRERNAKISVKSLLKKDDSEVERNLLQPAVLDYTGFTAKFINLSTKTLHLHWDHRSGTINLTTIPPFESFTTVTSPGNSFFLAPTYDKNHALQRWTLTADEAVVTYDPYSEDDVDALDGWTTEERTRYRMQKLSVLYGREYLAKNKGQWLATFPRPMAMHYMWDAEYFGQQHVVTTAQTHFVRALPGRDAGDDENHEDRPEVWKKLDYADYDDLAERADLDNNGVVFHLPEYREKGTLDLTLKVVSVTPRVFEIENFLSLTEVDHFLEMARVFNTTTTTTTPTPTNENDSSNLKKKPKKKSKDKSKTTPNQPIPRSTDTWIHREFSPIIDTIYRRTSDVLQIDESLLRHRNEHEQTDLNTYHSIAEAIHVDRYRKGEGYPARHDCSQPKITNRYQPLRFVTLVLFLGGGEDEEKGLEGGDMVFPSAVNAKDKDGVRVTAEAGKAVLYYNVLPDGNLDDLCHHMGEAVVEGEKWTGTLWVWDPIID